MSKIGNWLGDRFGFILIAFAIGMVFGALLAGYYSYLPGPRPVVPEKVVGIELHGQGEGLVNDPGPTSLRLYDPTEISFEDPPRWDEPGEIDIPGYHVDGYTLVFPDRPPKEDGMYLVFHCAMDMSTGRKSSRYYGRWEKR